MDGLDDFQEGVSNDIVELFRYYNVKHFHGALSGCSVEWSKRMTLCAGLCCYHALQGCRIKLSEPLLKFRPRSDLLDTLLHEMIHAFLFVTKNNKDRDDHGPNFQSWMKKINGSEGTSISIYHSFHDEVDLYRVHHWQCQGQCSRIIKRSMNRAPGSSDWWWKEHLSACGGIFLKIREPEKKERSVSKRKHLPEKARGTDAATTNKGKAPRHLEQPTHTLDHFFEGDSNAAHSHSNGGSSSRCSDPAGERPGVIILDSGEEYSGDSDDDEEDDAQAPEAEGHLNWFVHCQECLIILPEHALETHLEMSHGFL